MTDTPGLAQLLDETISSDGQQLSGVLSGRSALFGPNLVDFGYPSNFVGTAGPLHFTQGAANAPAFDSVSGGNVVVDVCAALA